MAAAPPDEALQHPVEVALPSECMDRRFFSRRETLIKGRKVSASRLHRGHGWHGGTCTLTAPSPSSVDRDGRLDLSVLCKHVATYTCARQPAFGDWILHDRIESMTPAEPASHCIQLQLPAAS
ncbi:hypothetical protein E5D57_012949 [Metarhizium anisopliae]|nr:hypothetical protein E5D57_012949 [Metarhizium anisopliae]